MRHEGRTTAADARRTRQDHDGTPRRRAIPSVDDIGKQHMIDLLTTESERVAATIDEYEVDRKVNNTRTADPRDSTLIEPI